MHFEAAAKLHGFEPEASSWVRGELLAMRRSCEGSSASGHGMTSQRRVWVYDEYMSEMNEISQAVEEECKRRAALQLGAMP